ncbi:ROK family protein [Schlesneria paludicola]|uniref:ROK family protein n=1 Tax=Schlesneria paludicola TaxID=360056 RepID=UPI00029B075E|nr:ROK family protein [Schlesneria paludicola]
MKDVLASDRAWVGFDLGGTKMNAMLFNDEFEVRGRRRKKSRGSEGVEAGIERIVASIAKLLEEAQLPRESLGGIGIGCPGPLDLEEGVILEAPNLGWKNVPLKKSLEKEFGCPVFVCNDVDAGVYGEYRFGAADGARTALGVFPGTGIGGAMIYEGKIFRGKTGSCLEIGHVPVVPDGALCGCGRRGCLETIASRLALSAEIAKAAYRGQAPYILRVAGTDLANIRSGTIKESIDAGDKIVDEILRNGAQQLGLVLAGAVNLLAPDVIVLGGGLVEALPKLFLEEIGKALAKQVMPSFSKSYEVRIARLGDDAGAMGAAAWARHNVEA